MITATDKTQPRPFTDQDQSAAVGPILVATDGTESGAAAIRAGAMLAQHTEAEVIVLSVLEGLPLIGSDYGILIPPIDADVSRREGLLTRVRAQVAGVDARTNWKIEIRDGDPPAIIARAARELNARLIIVGLGHHDLLDRLFGGETTIHALRLARTPVLAVPPDFNELPQRVVLATDFSAASVRAARIALELIDTAKAVFLVHVAPQLDVQPEALAAWTTMFAEGIGPAFERVKSELSLPAAMTVETVARNGKPSRELLDYAGTVAADLIVTGSRGAGVVDRILVGSTATGVLRGAQCAVLAVPDAARDRDQDRQFSNERTSIPASRWADELETFTRRNLGRHAVVEVDDPELGAQAQEHDYPFLGASWDRHDERVQIMLGDFEATGRHLTRGIGGVTGIDILRDEHDRDRVLRVQHGQGQTIVTLAR